MSNEMNNYQKHFNKELKILRDCVQDGDELVIEQFVPDIISIMEKFSGSGHSGGSAGYASKMISEAVLSALTFSPLSPLTGSDDEWSEVDSGGITKQNKRDSRFFIDDNKDAFFLDGIVWQGEDEYDTFTGEVQGVFSRVKVKFPVYPKTFYINVKKAEGIDPLTGNWVEDENDNKYHYIIKNIDDLDEVMKYYGDQGDI